MSVWVNLAALREFFHSTIVDCFVGHKFQLRWSLKLGKNEREKVLKTVGDIVECGGKLLNTWIVVRPSILSLFNDDDDSSAAVSCLSKNNFYEHFHRTPHTALHFQKLNLCITKASVHPSWRRSWRIISWTISTTLISAGRVCARRLFIA